MGLMEANHLPSNYLESVSSSDESTGRQQTIIQGLSEVSSTYESDNVESGEEENNSQSQVLYQSKLLLAAKLSLVDSSSCNAESKNIDLPGLPEISSGNESGKCKSAENVTEISFAIIDPSSANIPKDKNIDSELEPLCFSNSLNDHSPVQDTPSVENCHPSLPLKENRSEVTTLTKTERKVTPLKIKIGKRAGAVSSEASTEDDTIEKKTNRKKKKRRKISKEASVETNSRRQSKLGEFFSSKIRDVDKSQSTGNQNPSCILDIEEKLFSKTLVCLV